MSVDPDSGAARSASAPKAVGRCEEASLGSPQQRRALVALSLVPGLGTGRIRALLAYLTSPVDVWKASRSRLESVPGVGPKVAEAVLTFDGHDIVDRQMRRAKEMGATLLTPWDDAFPERLRQIYDPPAFLWMRGQLTPADARCIAVVGTRRCTDYGRQQACRFGAELTKHGLTVVSGLAYGVDAAAHRGALDAGGRTVAVLGSGLGYVYPASNRPLAEAMTEHGAVLSEYPIDAEPDPRYFPERNRIVSGLTLGTLVVESHAEGGALITARMALEQNREVFAVPGEVTTSASRGTNALIRRGEAKLVSCVDDILDELCLPAMDHETREAAAESVADTLTGDARALYEALGDSPTHLDDLCQEVCCTPSDALVALLQLEFDGHVRQLAGKQFRRT
ncbi:DNA-processing protein DprA [Longibacter salinarum]|uniref:DNA-processing protein DprA n=1 Tax=Longibacter salinarum TaxID=1850348 RepID=UPI001FE3409A|nr:DNA-processing protein DprA [Longibacter salinarum]